MILLRIVEILLSTLVSLFNDEIDIAQEILPVCDRISSVELPVCKRFNPQMSRTPWDTMIGTNSEKQG